MNSGEDSAGNEKACQSLRVKASISAKRKREGPSGQITGKNRRKPTGSGRDTPPAGKNRNKEENNTNIYWGDGAKKD